MSVSLEFLNKFEGVRLAPSSEAFLFLIRSVVLLLLLALLLVGESVSLLMIVTTASSSQRRGVAGLSSSSVLPRIQLKMLLWLELQRIYHNQIRYIWLHNRFKVPVFWDLGTARSSSADQCRAEWITKEEEELDR